MLVVDTDVLIDVQRGFEAAVDWFTALPETPCVIGFTVLELIQDARNHREVDKALRLVRDMRVLWPSSLSSQKALSCFADRHLSHGIGLLDVLIAFTAIEFGAELCTFNLRHFRAVDDLRLLQPHKR